MYLIYSCRATFSKWKSFEKHIFIYHSDLEVLNINNPDVNRLKNNNLNGNEGGYIFYLKTGINAINLKNKKKKKQNKTITNE